MDNNYHNKEEIQDEENTETSQADNEMDYKDKYLRCLAELENLRKQTFKQLEETRAYSITSFAKELLNVMDVFDKALASIDVTTIENDQFKNFIDGITLTKQELSKIFNKFNIQPLGEDLVNTSANPNLHEIIFTKSDKNLDNGIIFQVFEQGYTINGRLLRAAKVGVIKN